MYYSIFDFHLNSDGYDQYYLASTYWFGRELILDPPPIKRLVFTPNDRYILFSYYIVNRKNSP
jgi:hypothetical protein